MSMKTIFPNKNISPRMKLVGRIEARCNHYCKNEARKMKFYDWYSYLDNEFIKRMCRKCALRETWGYNYKSSRNFKSWLAELS